MGYMINLNIENKLCVIVGGGRGAEIKLRGLKEAGAYVRIVAPKISSAAAELADESMYTEYESSVIEGAVLVYAMTDNDEVNRKLVEDARERNIHVCRGSDGDFTVPAVRKGRNMTVAVSTGNPKLSVKIVERIIKEYE